MNNRIYLIIALMVSWLTLEAKSELNIQLSRSEDGTMVFADVMLENESRISSLTFDMTYPEGLTYVSATPVGLGQKQDAEHQTFDIWNVFAQDHKIYQYVRVVAMAKFKRDIRKGGNDALVRITFAADPTFKCGVKDFMFNSASAVDGMEREDVRMPIGVMPRSGIMSFCTTQDMIIEGATVYYAQLQKGTLYLNPVTSGVAIHHNDGVVLKGKEGTVIYGTSVDFANTPARNDLSASIHGETFDPGSVYVLATKGGVSAFYPNADSIVEVNRAYLKADTIMNRIPLDFNGLKNAEIDIFEIYHIDGPRVQEIRKGLR